MGNLSRFRSFLVSKRIMDKKADLDGWEYHDLPSELLSHSAEKNRTGILQCVTELGIKNFFCIRAIGQDFFSNFFVSQCRKKMLRILLVFHSFRLSTNFMHKRGLS